ncbi:hypothetical protein D9756_009504 [Leucocoprinus leucothites]|uniref:Uncharacterized protein n=1 Tax=Leucocoprinus leucothites TaxID=201217 RepID=A0A8H5FUI2_9AGAR|nr:hypothetical protein D9756_009504 [Leucoagaricus leucothites]
MSFSKPARCSAFQLSSPVMHFSSAFAALGLFVATSLAAPTALHTIETFSGETTGRHIVTLKEGVSKASLIAQIKQNATITHEFDIINGFAGHFDEDTLNALRASPDVELIGEDGIMHTMVTQYATAWMTSIPADAYIKDQCTMGYITIELEYKAEQPEYRVREIPVSVTHGLSFSHQFVSALTFTYTYDSAAGAGVDIFIVGILTTHTQFGGRARWGETFGPYANTERPYPTAIEMATATGLTARMFKYYTHAAVLLTRRTFSGTAAGSQYGVAKSANLVAVKVLSDAGSLKIGCRNRHVRYDGEKGISELTELCSVSGLNFVLSSATRPTVASMSLGGGASTALDNAVASLTRGGVHVTVAAGNDGADAGNTSPARSPSANTVGATTIADARASFSNFGSVVDIFAPGQNVISAWSTSNTATNNISGTSMATPHVAGLIAYLISVRGNMSPAAMTSLLQSLSLKGVISGVPSGTINDLGHNA